jgi:hypothetical protein
MLCGVVMRIECSCPLWPSAEAWLGVVFLIRDELCRGGKRQSRGEGTSGGTRISPEYVPRPRIGSGVVEF